MTFSGAPSIKIVSPAPGSTVAGDFTVTVAIQNFNPSCDLYGKPDVSGYGHWHLNLDGVSGHLAAGVLQHAVDGRATPPDAAMPGTVRTRYVTRLWFGTVTTTEDATLDPGRSITWRHVGGPLRGSAERFDLQPRGDATLVLYRGEIRARHPLFHGPLGRFFVAPTTRRVSLDARRHARRELDGS